jgi:uncharacterized repeat protein (TIGR01451 family)
MQLDNNAKTKSFKAVIIMALLAFITQQNLILALASATSTDLLVETGNSQVNLGSFNDINQNHLADEADISDELDLFDSASTTPESTATGTDEIDENMDEPDGIYEDAASGTPHTVIDIINDAETDTLLSGLTDTGENKIAGTSGAEINTGDADLSAIIGNDINKNTLNDSLATTTASSGPAAIIGNDNNATTTNILDLEGNTGKNEISSSSGDALIDTGDINIISAIVNYINTNFFGKGKQFFVNIFDQFTGNIDLSGHEGGESDAELPQCEGENCHIYLDNKNNSGTENNINIKANTGDNLIEGSGGTSVIETGDINIINDIVNINNLNIAGDDWYFAVVNIFGVLDGDIILPGMNPSEYEVKKFAAEAEKLATNTKEIIITNKNNADILNNIDINTQTGENLITDGGEAMIKTGDAAVEMTAFNLINYNYTGDQWKFAKVNIFGNWKGIVENLPPGYGYFKDDNGVTIYNEYFDADAFINSFAKLMVENDNNADIANNIIIDANTGSNSISGEGRISTGDISVKNNLLNFINSNFTGQNWEFSLINVFGEWRGNLAFGQPDLWMIQSADTGGKSELSKGDLVTYKILFGNNGDSLATKVKIVDDYDENFLAINSSSGNADGGRMTFDIGSLPPNSQGSISYSAIVRDDIPTGRHDIENTARISSLEKDRNYADNISGLKLSAHGGNNEGSPVQFASNSVSGTSAAMLPNLSIVKTNNSQKELNSGETVNYSITIKNTGEGDLTEVLVDDTMYSLESGEKIASDIWDIGTLKGGEKVLIEYSIEINGAMPSGTYINEAAVEGYDPLSGKYISAAASSKIKVENNKKTEEKEPQIVIGSVNKSGPAIPGDEVDFKLIIANNGQGKAINASLEAVLPDGLMFLDSKDSKIKYDFDQILPGEIINIDKRVKISDFANPGVYSSLVSFTGENTKKQQITYDLELKSISENSYDKSKIQSVTAKENQEKRGSSKIRAAGLIYGSDSNEAENILDNNDKSEGGVLGIQDNFGKLAFSDDSNSAFAAGSGSKMTKSFNKGDMVMLSIVMLIVAALVPGMKKYRFNN